MANLRAQAEKDLFYCVEKDWSVPVVLIDPAGNTIDRAVGGDRPLRGLFFNDCLRLHPDTGERIVVGEPWLLLRRKSLKRVPEAGETWIVKAPLDPFADAPLHTFLMDPTRAPEPGSTIGYIKLFLRQTEQQQ
ncbi:MAG: hypothetical protein GY874_02700 [Desulfobacteraceae bacterium]|nr:hypothetical protein [Desulfobacteraceae bacterium]